MLNPTRSITEAELTELRPCLPEDAIRSVFRGRPAISFMEALDLPEIPVHHLLWIGRRMGVLTRPMLHTFAIREAGQALEIADRLGEPVHPAWIEAVRSKERWLSGRAEESEVRDARRAAFEWLVRFAPDAPTTLILPVVSTGHSPQVEAAFRGRWADPGADYFLPGTILAALSCIGASDPSSFQSACNASHASAATARLTTRSAAIPEPDQGPAKGRLRQLVLSRRPREAAEVEPCEKI